LRTGIEAQGPTAHKSFGSALFFSTRNWERENGKKTLQDLKTNGETFSSSFLYNENDDF
jgi:hypothetical protein